MNTATREFHTPLPWRPRFWPFRVPERIGSELRWIARVWLVVVTIIFSIRALQGGIPRGLDQENWEVTVQLALFGLVVLGEILAWRWQALGASLIATGAIALGVLAAIQYSPPYALMVAMVFFVPAFLYWLDWQRTRSVGAIVLLALAMVAALATGGYGAMQVYAAYRGPTHAASSQVAQPVTLVEWIWSGGQTENSITVNAGLARDNDSVYLAVSDAQDMTNPTMFGPVTSDAQANNRTVSIHATGLDPDTQYYYAIVAGGEMDLSRQGQFRTLAEGPFSFTFALGGCAATGSNGQVFDAIRQSNPLFYVINGDLFYGDITVNDPDRYRSSYVQSLTAPAQAALYRSVPVVYLWDDHDFGPNNADRTAPGREVALQVFHQIVPHHPLATSSDLGPIYRAFTVGRVRFIVTDERSMRSPDAEPDSAAKTMLGAEQKAWFKQQLLEANGRYPVIVWVNSVPWIGAPEQGSDSWAGYPTERQELADFIAENQIEGLMMLAGDAHMVAIDDGTNSDYSTTGGAGFPVFHASALDRPGSVKGGPYSEGTFPGGGHFGLVKIDDAGATITVTLTGLNYKGEELVSYSFMIPAHD